MASHYVDAGLKAFQNRSEDVRILKFGHEAQLRFPVEFFIGRNKAGLQKVRHRPMVDEQAPTRVIAGPRTRECTEADQLHGRMRSGSAQIRLSYEAPAVPGHAGLRVAPLTF